jgi:galactose mutarotase-like enzyme
MESDLLRVTVLPDKGADIVELIHKPSGVDCLMKTPWGLKPPGPVTDFLANYEGGWQELFPSCNDACEFRGQAIAFHGETPLLSWTYEILAEAGAEIAVRFSVRSRALPLRLERTMRLRENEPILTLSERVSNLGAEPAPFTWGHHLVLGAPFLDEGCRLDVPAGVILSREAFFEPETAALALDQGVAWPLARARQPGQHVDLRAVRGPEAHAHDDIFVGDLARGEVRVTNPRLGLAVTLAWDAEVFRYLLLWLAYGGADLPPLTGMYGLGVEPWLARYDVTRAAAEGEARVLAPGETLETELRVSFAPVGN